MKKISLEKYLQKELRISEEKANKIPILMKEYKKLYKKKLNILVPKYSLGEELFNSISHGIGALLSIAALVLMTVKAKGALSETCVSLFGSTMIILYTISCIYHALSPNIEGKKVLRVIDHCNVYLLVLGTYIPVSLIGIGSSLGWVFFSIVTVVTITGISLSSTGIDKYSVLEVICHLVSGWAALFAIPRLLQNIGFYGLLFLILGGVMYTIGSILYGLGSNKKYMHCLFHIFCLLGTFFHFWCIYRYII